MELLTLSEGKLFILLQVMNDVDKIINFFVHSYYSKTGIFVKFMRSLNEMEELKRFQGSTFGTIARR